MMANKTPVNWLAVASITYVALSAASSIASAGGNFGGIDQQPYVALFGGGDLIVARVKGTNTFTAYSKHSGVWRSHTFAKNLSVVPISGSDGCCGFRCAGGNIDELVAVDREGNWRRHKLATTTKECNPVVSANVVAYQISDQAYAFSGIKGVWDSTPFKRVKPKDSFSIDRDLVTIFEPNRIQAFSAQTGVWAKSPLLIPAEQASGSLTKP